MAAFIAASTAWVVLYEWNLYELLAVWVRKGED